MANVIAYETYRKYEEADPYKHVYDGLPRECFGTCAREILGTQMFEAVRESVSEASAYRNGYAY